ncbi:MAG TPA: SRPBCC domain-containing protein [Gemmatimonadaceae bacterium]|jgi:uncharacterized protein YndB with AHSA1/START domain
MTEYETMVVIDAPPEQVWQVLTDGGAYHEWNPEIVGVEGRMGLGERIVARVRLGDGALRRVPMRVSRFEVPSRMEWLGGLPLGLFVGRRTFTVTPRAGKSEFRLHLEMSGLLSPLISRSVGDRQPEVDTFSAALKRRVEERG